MTAGAGEDGGDQPPCGADGCTEPAAFYVFDGVAGDWRPRCGVHTEQLHPSLEVHAWQAAGFLKPVELGRPQGSPSDPASDRAEHFRREVRRVMGWLG